MSIDMCLEPKKGAEISVGHLMGDLLARFPESHLEDGGRATLLLVKREGVHLADATANGEEGALDWTTSSSLLICSIVLNGAEAVCDVAEELLRSLDLKDVTSGDEEEEIGSLGDDILAEIEREREEFNRTARDQSTKLGVFRPKDCSWMCDSVACAPTCFARIDAPEISDSDIRTIAKVFKAEAPLRDGIAAEFDKELKRDYKLKMLGVGLRGVVLQGELNEDPDGEDPELEYAISAAGKSGPESWTGTASIRKGKIVYSTVLQD